MIQISIPEIQKLKNSTDIEDLRYYLQKAIELEHATIPPYLTAAFSIKENTNQEVKKTLMDIAKEEMLHFTIAANILIAVGGQPFIYAKSFIPDYPAQLPLSVGDSLMVGLEKVSIKQIKDTFLEIEEPENPILFPLKNVVVLDGLSNQDFGTIGQFYELIKTKLKELKEEDFVVNLSKQVTGLFSPQHLFPIKTKEDAIKAIDIIVEQGEGTTQLPTGIDDDLAHYYKFKEIVVGRRLIKDENAELRFSYSGAEISLDEAVVYPLYPNLKSKDLEDGTSEKEIINKFNTCYSQMLKDLDEGFNGKKEAIEKAYFAMYEMTEIAKEVVKTPHPIKGMYTLCPSFEFVNI